MVARSVKLSSPFQWYGTADAEMKSLFVHALPKIVQSAELHQDRRMHAELKALQDRLNAS